MPHIHEKIDFTVSVYVVYKNKVLLRMHDKYHIWCGPGGHIELDEDPNQAAIREVKEEVGLDVELIGNIPKISEGSEYKELLPPNFMNIHYINKTHQHMDMIYFAKAKSDDVKPAGDDLSTEWRWLSKEDLENKTLNLSEAVHFYASSALKNANK